MTRTTIFNGNPRCCSVSMKTGVRCRAAAQRGHAYCGNHLQHRQRASRAARDRVYLVTVNLKGEYLRYAGEPFRYWRRVVGRPFHTAEAAWDWLRANWDNVAFERPNGRRFVSASVQDFYIR